MNTQQRLKARRERRNRRIVSERTRRTLGNPVTVFERELDGWTGEAWRPSSATPPVLYHYTSWEGFAGIIRTASFYCTAHRCTNDMGELQTADAAIVNAAAAVLSTCGVHSKDLLHHFLNTYERSRFGELFTIYLACFSAARDKAAQWEKYADAGRGVCIGVRLLADEQFESGPGALARILLQVNYQPESFVPGLTDEYPRICARFDGLVSTHRHRKQAAMRWAWNAMHRRAAVESARTKSADWAAEEEWRHIVIGTGDDKLDVIRTERNGKLHEKVLLPMRPGGRRLALAEVIVGRSQDFGAAQDKVRSILGDAGYSSQEFDLPLIASSGC